MQDEPSAASSKYLLVRRRGWATFLAVAFGSLSFAVLTPPFHVPDEGNHLLRAAHISEGHLLGSSHGNDAGGLVDSGVIELHRLNSAVWGPVSAEALHASSRLRFSGQPAFASFANTVRYFPAFYLPQAASWQFGKWIGLGLMQSFYLARMLNSLCMAGLAATGIAMSQRGSSLFVLTMLLPMSLFESGSISQDAGIIATSVFLVATLTQGPIISKFVYIGCAVCILMLAGARFPLIGLLPILWMPTLRRRVGNKLCCGLSASVLIAFSGWFVLTQASPGVVRSDAAVEPSAQVSYLLHNPSLLATLPVRTLLNEWRGWWSMTVGVLGWLNILLPQWAYSIAFLALLIACVDTMLTKDDFTYVDRGIAAVCVIGTLLLMLWGSYISWTPVAHLKIEGMQGRYFLSLLPVLSLALPCCRVKSSHILLLARSFGRITLAILLFSLYVGATRAMESKYISLRDAPSLALGIKQ